jgi:hypothetical protein
LFKLLIFFVCVEIPVPPASVVEHGFGSAGQHAMHRVEQSSTPSAATDACMAVFVAAADGIVNRLAGQTLVLRNKI